jgi:hypothetical protein
MFVDTYTSIHSILSLLALVLGLVVLLDFFGVRIPSLITGLFLLLAFLTSATGFGFPFNGILPSHVVGVLALIAFAAAAYGRYIANFAGLWRSIYVIGIVASEFFLAFVGVAQAFGKITALNALAPTQSEPPFAITQLVLLLICAIIGVVGVRGYRRDMTTSLGPREAVR